jgi:hypothetical protein
MFTLWGLILALFMMPLALRAAEVLTNDGQTFEGKILEEQTDYLLLEIENGVQVKIERSQIVYVKKEDDANKRKREYPLLGATFGDPAIFNVVAGYFWDDIGFKLAGGYWGSFWGAQLNLSKTLTGKDPFHEQTFRDISINFSLVGGLAGNDGSTRGSRWSNNTAAGNWTYGGLGLDFNVSGLFLELDGVTGNFPANITFPFQIGYVHRFN